MQYDNMASLSVYRRLFLDIQRRFNSGNLTKEAANVALVGIAQGLNIINPKLL